MDFNNWKKVTSKCHSDTDNLQMAIKHLKMSNSISHEGNEN